MHWSLKIIIDMPRAILEFRRNHIKMSRLHKVEKEHGSIAGYKAMLEDPDLAKAELAIYVDMLPLVMEDANKYSEQELEWFLGRGEELGVIKKIEEAPIIDDSWRKWEEGS